MCTGRLGATVCAVLVLALVRPVPAVGAAADAPGHDTQTSSHDSSASLASPQAQAVIPFANLGGIYDWAADGTRGIYIQSINRHWYYAKLLGPCIDLPFALRVGFVTEPGNGNFDRFSSILVRGQECPVVSLTRSGPPPGSDHRWRSRQGRQASSAPG